MNDGIKPELCSFSYPSVEEVASMACSLGLHALMVKMDLKNEKRDQMMPVHADNQSYNSYSSYLFLCALAHSIETLVLANLMQKTRTFWL